MNSEPTLPPSTEIGTLGVYHLKRIWSSAIAETMGIANARKGERPLDIMVLDALGTGLLQTYRYLYSQAPSFTEFEDWIIDTAGKPDKLKLQRLNARFIKNFDYPETVKRWLRSIERMEPVLSERQLALWKENGYVILRNAVPEQSRKQASNAIWNRVGADPDDSDSWYGPHNSSIIVELIQHPALEENRRSQRIHKAFSQLWSTADLWVSADRCGFHPPQRSSHPFPGPDLHWDVGFSEPLAFATQGILYLEDTAENQGALTLVPGFHQRLPDWLQQLEAGSDPQAQDLHALGPVPIAARAGDLIIWHHHLPHGSRPNLGTRPRLVQYINMHPGGSVDV